MLHQIKRWLRGKPTAYLASNSSIGVLGLFGVNLDSLATSASSSGIGQKLCFAAVLQTYEPTDTTFNGLSTCKKTVVRENGGFPLA